MALQKLHQCLFAWVLVFTAFLPVNVGAERSGDPDTLRIEKIIHDYLLRNPEILVEVMQKLEARQKAQEKKDRISAIKANQDTLFASTQDFVLNPNGRIPVVEFFDYQCGYCKNFLPVVTQLLETDKTVRFIFKELPILGEMSVLASRAALAAKMQGRYLQFHHKLMGLRQRVTKTLLYQVANDVGLNLERLKNDMQNPEHDRIIKKNLELASAMGIRGTPSIIVGEQFAPGAVSFEQIIAMVDKARINCSVC